MNKADLLFSVFTIVAVESDMFVIFFSEDLIQLMETMREFFYDRIEIDSDIGRVNIMQCDNIFNHE
jgi:hypothetical protein